MPTPQPTGGAGVLVLGAHRSGTSLLAGVVAALGVPAGPPERIRGPDTFNPDGYHEDRLLIEWHDAMLHRSGGWASAPPDRVAVEPADVTALAPLLAPYPGAGWFVKDPRQCLLLDAWSAARGIADLAIVIVRDPAEVADSLHRRSTYSHATGFALWERYNHDLLASLAGRRTLLITYEQLVERPSVTIAAIAAALHPLVESPDAGALERIAASIRRQRRVDLPTPAACTELMTSAAGLTGDHPSFPILALAPVSSSARRTIQRRRVVLNLARPLRLATDARTSLDEAIGRVRGRFSGSHRSTARPAGSRGDAAPVDGAGGGRRR